MSETPSKVIATIVGVILAILLMSMLFLYVTGQKNSSMTTEKQMAEQNASIDEGRFLQYDGEVVDGSEVMAAVSTLGDEGVQILVNANGHITAMTDADGKINANYTTAKQKGDSTYVAPAQTFTGRVERDSVTGRITRLTFDVEGDTAAVTPDVAVHTHSSDDDALARTIYVSYYKNDGTEGLLEKATATKEESLYITATRPTRTGYTFVGWSESNSDTTATYTSGQAVNNGFSGNVSLYAIWAEKTYSVTYNLSESASEIDSTEASSFGYDASAKKYKEFTVSSTEDYNIPTTIPTRSGYTFNGWGTRANGSVLYNVGDTYTGKTSVTLYAIWSRNAYTISFDGNGSTSGSMNDVSVFEGNGITLSTNRFEKPGYKFKGWSTSSSGSVEYADTAYVKLTDSDVDSDKKLTLYAVWSAVETYSINYDVNNGSWSEKTSDSVEDGELYSIPAKKPTRSNYVFKGWSDGSKTYSAGSTVKITSDTEFEAQWKADEHSYKVNYYLCDVDGIEDKAHAKLEQTFSYTTTATSVIPYMFDYTGYETPAKKSYEIDVDGSSEIDIFYKRQQYKLTLKADTGVTINDNSGVVVNPDSKTVIEVTYGDTRSYTALANEKLGLDWYKWDSDPYMVHDSKNALEFEMPNRDITVTAHAKAPQFYITYNLNGMKNNTKNSATFKADVKTHIYSPSQRGYVFTGWESGNLDSSKADKHLPAEWNPVKGPVYDLEFDIPVNTRSNQTFTAHKRRSNYTIKYDKNFETATGTMADSAFQYDQGINLNDNGVADSLPTLRKNAFAATDWQFYGWNTKADGSGTFFNDEETVTDNRLTEDLADGDIDGANITLYAIWYKAGNEAEIVESDWVEPTSAIDVGTTLKKNPAIANNVGWDTWGIIRVTVPQHDSKDVVTLNGISDDYELLFENEEDGYHIMYYGYKEPIARYKTSPDLFKSITIQNAGFHGATSVDVKGFTVEKKYFTSINEVWNANLFR